ncbi:MAG: ABC transporter ATP-binding protein [Bacteroidales bacterium]
MVDPLLEVRNLELHYGRQRVVHDVSFQLFPGRVQALIGPNGAGKSSIIRILAGLVRPEKGELVLGGNILSSAITLHHSAGFFIESPDFYKNLDARQNLKLLNMIRKADQSASELLRIVGLEYAAGKKVRKFSRGMKQRLGIAQALLGDPEILVLDEPFNGLDPEVKQFLMDLIRKLASEENKAILVSSHLLSDLEALADDFVLLSEGAVHVSGKLSDFRNQPQTVYFWFEKEPSLTLLEETTSGKMVHMDPWCWETHLSTGETTELLGKWISAGCVPFEIERADLLQSKYNEIIK